MKYVFLLLILTVPGLGMAQQKKKAKKEQFPSLLVGAHFIFQHSGISIHENSEWDQVYNDILFFQGGSGRAGGLQVIYGLNKQMDIVLGAGLNRQSIVQTSNFPIDCCEPAEYGATEQEGANRFVTIRSLEVPLEFRYKLYIGKAFSLYPAIGPHLIFTTSKEQAVEVYMDNSAVAAHPDNDFELDNDRPVNLAFSAKIGFRLQLAKPFFLKVEPFYKRQFLQEQLLTDFDDTSLYSFGILAGVEYALLFRKE